MIRCARATQPNRHQQQRGLHSTHHRLYSCCLAQAHNARISLQRVRLGVLQQQHVMDVDDGSAVTKQFHMRCEGDQATIRKPITQVATLKVRPATPWYRQTRRPSPRHVYYSPLPTLSASRPRPLSTPVSPSPADLVLRADGIQGLAGRNPGPAECRCLWGWVAIEIIDESASGLQRASVSQVGPWPADPMCSNSCRCAIADVSLNASAACAVLAIAQDSSRRHPPEGTPIGSCTCLHARVQATRTKGRG